MKRNLTAIGAFLAVIISLACGGGEMEWKGSAKGTYKLFDARSASSNTYPPPAPVDTGSAGLTFTAGPDNVLQIGKDTPLPDCRITFYPGTARRDNAEKAVAMEYKLKGEGMRCQGRSGKQGPNSEMEIVYANVSLKDDGEIYVSVVYCPPTAYDKEQELQITAQKGWF